jgi:hypothetical protein
LPYLNIDSKFNPPNSLRYMKIKNVPWGSPKNELPVHTLTPDGPNKMWYQMKSYVYIQQNVVPNENLHRTSKWCVTLWRCHLHEKVS